MSPLSSAYRFLFLASQASDVGCLKSFGIAIEAQLPASLEARSLSGVAKIARRVTSTTGISGKSKLCVIMFLRGGAAW